MNGKHSKPVPPEHEWFPDQLPDRQAPPPRPLPPRPLPPPSVNPTLSDPPHSRRVSRVLPPPDQRDLLPEQRVPLPDQRLWPPDQQALPPDEHVRLPDQQVAPPDQRVVPPEQQVRLPDRQVLPPSSEAPTEQFAAIGRREIPRVPDDRVPILPPAETAPFHRVGLLAAVGVAALVLAAGVGGYVWLQSTSGHGDIAAPEVPTAGAGNPVITASSTASSPPVAAPPPTTIAPPVTTTTTTVAPSTVSHAAPAQTAPADGLPTSGRLSGTIVSRSGTAWVVAGWYGDHDTIRVTPSTKLVPRQQLIGPPQEFAVGQTVNVFWHSVGRSMVADSIYGN